MKEEIQYREIRGVNLRWLVNLVIIVGTAAAAYVVITVKGENMKTEIHALKEEVLQLQADYKELKKQADDNTNEIKYYHRTK